MFNPLDMRTANSPTRNTDIAIIGSLKGLDILLPASHRRKYTTRSIDQIFQTTPSKPLYNVAADQQEAAVECR